MDPSSERWCYYGKRAIESAIEKNGKELIQHRAHLVAKLSAGSSSVPLYNQTAGNSLEEAPKKLKVSSSVGPALFYCSRDTRKL